MKGPEDFEQSWTEKDQSLLEQLKKLVEDRFARGSHEVELNVAEVGHASWQNGNPLGEHVWDRFLADVREAGWSVVRTGGIIRIKGR